jgi:hypothetical protein
MDIRINVMSLNGARITSADQDLTIPCVMRVTLPFPILGCKSDVQHCALQSYFAASSGNFLPTFWDSISVPS